MAVTRDIALRQMQEAPRKEFYLIGCPFCGAKPVVFKWHRSARRIRCENEECLVAPSVTGSSIEEAGTAWNTRRALGR